MDGGATEGGADTMDGEASGANRGGATGLTNRGGATGPTNRGGAMAGVTGFSRRRVALWCAAENKQI